MRYLVVVFTLLLTGCSTVVPVTAKFPSAPATLLESCPKELKAIEGDKVNIIDLTKTIVDNYETYHICADKSDAWIEWYNIQKKIFEEVE
jgi:uncharacterized protein YceK